MKTVLPDPRITWAMDHMHRCLGQRVDPVALAYGLNLSPSHFCHLFTAQAGIGPARYLERLRMQRARVLIERTFLTVPYVMILVGYDDGDHFARDFERHHGVFPETLRTATAATPLPTENKGPVTADTPAQGAPPKRRTGRRDRRAKTRDPSDCVRTDAEIRDELLWRLAKRFTA